MSENTMPEQDEVALNAMPPEVPEMLAQSTTPEQMQKIKDVIAKFKASKETTLSGSEAVDETPAPAAQSGPPSGKDVDWSEYDLNPDLRHLYPQAQFRETPQGAKWVALVEEFISIEREWGQRGQKQTNGDAKNLGEYLNDMLNGPEGWAVVMILPASTGRVGVLLRRQAPVILPDPKQLEKVTEVAPPSDPELDKIEQAAIAFAAEQGTPVE